MEMTVTVESIDGLLKSLRDNGASPNTIRAYRADLIQFGEWAGPIIWPENAEAVAKQYLNTFRETWAPKTTRRKISSLRALGRAMGYPDFLLGYRAPTPARAVPHPLPEGPNGVLDLLDQCGDDPEALALVALCGLCGARVSEARGVRLVDLRIGTDGRWVMLHGKGNKFRMVPITDLAWKYIRLIKSIRMMEGDIYAPLYSGSDRTARRLVTRLGQMATLARPVASHDLRATFLTAAYRRSKNLRVVQELAGHASSQTTELYTGITEEEMRDAARVAGD